MSGTPGKSGSAAGPSNKGLLTSRDTAGPLGASGGARARRYKIARDIKAAKAAKKNAKLDKVRDNQTLLMRVFENMQLVDDPAHAIFTTDLDSDIQMTSELAIDASTVVDEIPEQRDDDEGAAASTSKPKHRKRKNRKAKNDRAYMISGVDPIELRSRREPDTRSQPGHLKGRTQL